MTFRKVQDGSRVNRPGNQPHLFIHLLLHLVAGLAGWISCRHAHQRYFWATVKFTEASVTEKERDCGTDYAKLGQESWGSSQPLLLQSGELILSLLLSTCKLTRQQAPDVWQACQLLAVCLLTLGRTRGQWNIQHEWNFTPGDLILNLKDQFVESPAGCAVHRPPTNYMKTHRQLRYCSSITRSPPITPPWHHLPFLSSLPPIFFFPKPNMLPPLLLWRGCRMDVSFCNFS